MKSLFALTLLLTAPFSAEANDAYRPALTTVASATCYGGPGMYPYPCPEPAKPETCYGGPGMYPYPCPPRR